MPPRNRFRHQLYQAAPPTVDVAWIDAVAPPAQTERAWETRMAEVGERLRAANVSAVYLLHGTFVGDDVLGFSHLVSLVLPWAGQLLRERQKRLADWFVRDSGNYTKEYASTFERGINPPSVAARKRVPVRLFHWTSENHHLGARTAPCGWWTSCRVRHGRPAVACCCGDTAMEETSWRC